jgi:hypothetical protein
MNPKARSTPASSAAAVAVMPRGESAQGGALLGREAFGLRQLERVDDALGRAHPPGGLGSVRQDRGGSNRKRDALGAAAPAVDISILSYSCYLSLEKVVQSGESGAWVPAGAVASGGEKTERCTTT